MSYSNRTDQEREEDKSTYLFFMLWICWLLYGSAYSILTLNLFIFLVIIFTSVLWMKDLIARNRRITREREIRHLGVEIDSIEGRMLMARDYSTYEVTGYDDQGKIKFIHLREGDFVLPVEIKGDDLLKIKKMMELNPGVTVIIHAAVDQKRMRLLEVDGYSLRKEDI